MDFAQVISVVIPALSALLSAMAAYYAAKTKALNEYQTIQLAIIKARADEAAKLALLARYAAEKTLKTAQDLANQTLATAKDVALRLLKEIKNGDHK